MNNSNGKFNYTLNNIKWILLSNGIWIMWRVKIQFSSNTRPLPSKINFSNILNHKFIFLILIIWFIKTTARHFTFCNCNQFCGKRKKNRNTIYSEALDENVINPIYFTYIFIQCQPAQPVLASSFFFPLKLK